MEDLFLKTCRKLRFSNNTIENARRIKYTDNINFLLELFTLELENRELKRKNLYIKSARFDALKTFEDYSFDDIKISKSITPTDIIETNFIDIKENLILYGNVGSGKTHLAIATGIAACNNGKRVKFYRTAAMVNALVDAKKQGNIARFMKILRGATY